MPPRETTRSIASVTVLVALLFVAAAALRGYVPGAEQRPREVARDSPLAVAVVLVLLTASVGVMVIAVIARLRNRSPVAAPVADRSDWLRRDQGMPTWRAVLFTFGLILGWLLLTVAVAHLGGGSGGTPPSGTSPDPATTAPNTSAPTPTPALPPPRDQDSPLLGYFYGASVIVLVLLVVGTIVAARGQRRPAWAAEPPPGAESGSEPESGSESLARAAEVGLAEVGDLSREPRKAIIACYAAMEGELSLLPDAAPRDFDTASEVLARAVHHHALAPDSATQLVDLFDEARFSSHVMDEGHRDAAVAVLRKVLGELRSHA